MSQSSGIAVRHHQRGSSVWSQAYQALLLSHSGRELVWLSAESNLRLGLSPGRDPELHAHSQKTHLQLTYTHLQTHTEISHNF